MKSRISALMDGEQAGREADGSIESLGREGEARETWRRYHLIGDSMRGTPQLSAGFAAGVRAKLAAEPTVLAPKSWPNARPILEQRRWQLLSAAASVAAVAFVSVAFFSQEAAVPVASQAAAPPAETAEVAPPEAANDYLLAHQGYSPRNSLQGVAPYVRTVSSESRGSRR